METKTATLEGKAIRGLQRVSWEWQFELAAYNIEKLKLLTT
jgi:hypothetical protein